VDLIKAAAMYTDQPSLIASWILACLGKIKEDVQKKITEMGISNQGAVDLAVDRFLESPLPPPDDVDDELDDADEMIDDVDEVPDSQGGG
jgi:hypothetical protein